MDALLSVATIYILIVIGFVFKRVFKDEVKEKSFVLLNLYFLQPILIFWGLTRAPIDEEFIFSPFIYFIAVFLTLALAFFYSKKIFKDYQDRSIFLAAALVGNTGNLGIPLGIALFGEASVPYTSILNIANMFYIYIFSVYFFAGDKFKFSDALKEIFKIPAIHSAILALLFNYYGLSLNENFEKVFTMGAYAAIVMQLIVFGIFMSQVRIRSANWNLSINITLFKHIILPIIGLFVIVYFKIDPFVGAIIFLELIVPLAVNNVNLSALYNCKPIDTTFAVIISTLSFIGFMAIYIIVIDKFFGV
ncbi:AEC family transporter [Halarcobacter bivalviorum]|uniref:AEC family transporter n=1 Tax=Halarcobacter bivalviorum TaxID=663364 RepID=UPI00100B5F17|nr:AEC family transporter [Halarcobacter bivalviorum]RXK06545.1 permease [Halarcobacter bivalviorum]